jgi:hypothetical protein
LRRGATHRQGGRTLELALAALAPQHVHRQLTPEAGRRPVREQNLARGLGGLPRREVREGEVRREPMRRVPAVRRKARL